MKKNEWAVKEIYDPIANLSVDRQIWFIKKHKRWPCNFDFGNKFLVNPKDFFWKWLPVSVFNNLASWLL